ncbi:MAG: hypothetical protein ACJ74E_08350 [Actinomycetes bacterium]
MMSLSVVGSVTGSARLVDEATADQLGPGLVAFTIVVLLGIATFFLLRSMLHHIRKVPPSFEDETPSSHEEEQGPSDSGVSKP